MFTLTYDHLNFDDNKLPDFVESVSNHLYGKRIIVKENFASGDYKILSFANGFQAYVSNYVLHQDFRLELSIPNDDYYALHINQIQAGPEFNIILNGESVSYDDKIVTSMFLTRSTDHFVLSGSRGTCVNRLKILVPKTWLTKYLPAMTDAVLNDYLNLKEERLFTDALDVTYRSLVDKVMNTEDTAHYLSITQNIAVVITERFFNRLKIKMQKNQWNNDNN